MGSGCAGGKLAKVNLVLGMRVKARAKKKKKLEMTHKGYVCVCVDSSLP